MYQLWIAGYSGTVIFSKALWFVQEQDEEEWQDLHAWISLLHAQHN